MPSRLKDRDAFLSPRWRVTNVAYDHDTRSHWAVTYVSDSTGGGTGSAFAARCGHRGAHIERDILLHSGAPNAVGAVDGGACFDDDADEFVVATGIAYNVSGGVIAHRIGHATAAPIVVDGASCSQAGISWTGAGNNQQIGHELCGVRVAGAPAGTVHFLMLSMAGQDSIVVQPLVAPGCRLHVDNITSAYLGVLPLAIGGTVGWRIPLPEFVPSMTLYFQDWHVDATGSLLEGTARLEVPIVR